LPQKRQGSTNQAVAEVTLKVLRRTVPTAVPSIKLLSGGQSPEEATANLNALNQQALNQGGGASPWQLGISYGRALQQPARHAWGAASPKMSRRRSRP